MLTPTDTVYPSSSDRGLPVLFNLRDPEACRQMFRLRDAFREDSTVEALQTDLVVMFLFPGAASRLLS